MSRPEYNLQGLVTSKLGGSVLATARDIRRSGELMRRDPDRRYIIISALGATATDPKLTRKLLSVFQGEEPQPIKDNIKDVRARFEDVERGLGIYTVGQYLDVIEKDIKNGRDKDENWYVSRGEWVTAQMFADFIDGSFIDAVDLIKLRGVDKIKGHVYDVFSDLLNGNSVYVIPGFYHEGIDGNIALFDFNGSDITGALIASATGSRLYENWKDVDGVKAVDPRIVPFAKTIKEMTYWELRELARRKGMEVLHPDAIAHLYAAGIPVQVRNAFNDDPFSPDHSGTLITKERIPHKKERVIGIAGSKDAYIAVKIKKIGMGDIEGIGSLIFDILRENKVSYERDVEENDSICILIPEKNADKLSKLERQIRDAIAPEDIVCERDLSIICLVGQGLKNDDGTTLMRALGALKKMGINPRITSHSIECTSITIGVERDKTNVAIKALYDELVKLRLADRFQGLWTR